MLVSTAGGVTVDGSRSQFGEDEEGSRSRAQVGDLTQKRKRVNFS